MNHFFRSRIQVGNETTARKYLFILSPPYCGSTILWRLLATSPNTSALPKEGQYIESVQKILRFAPWDSQNTIPWELVKREWELEWDLNKSILLEKSPPHLIRAFQIERVFSPAYFVVMMRDPYAFCEGYCRRQEMSIEEGALFWKQCAELQISNIDGLERTLFFTYETLTDDIANTYQALLHFLPELNRLDTEKAFAARSIVGYEAVQIRNYNQLKIGQLSKDDISRINDILMLEPKNLDYFNYSILDPGPLHDIQRIRFRIMLIMKRALALNKRVAKIIVKDIPRH